MWPFNKTEKMDTEKEITEEEVEETPPSLTSLRFKVVRLANGNYRTILLTDFEVGGDGQLALGSRVDHYFPLGEGKEGQVRVCYPLSGLVSDFGTMDKAIDIAKKYTEQVRDERNSKLVVEEKIIEFKV